MGSALNLKDIVRDFALCILERLFYLFVKDKPVNCQKVEKILASGGGGGIGDLLLALPAIESLNINFPHASISLLTSSESSEILLLYHKKEIIKGVIDYNARERHKSFYKKILLIYSLRKKQFDLSYFPSRGEGMRQESLMNYFIGAPNRLGFYKGNTGLLNTVKVELKDDVPLLDQNLAILKAANLKIQKPEGILRIPEKDMTDVAEMMRRFVSDPGFPIISVHPGALWRSGNKSWPIEKFISLIKYLFEEFHATIIIVGSKNESSISKVLSENVKNPSLINMIDKTSIAQMAAFIKQSHLFIGNDSGPLHIALLLNVPSIAIFGSTSPGQILHSATSCLVVSKNLDCSPCYLHLPCSKLDCDDVRCLKEITVEEVMNAARKMIVKKGKAR